jgi:hypothetical protein
MAMCVIYKNDLISLLSFLENRLKIGSGMHSDAKFGQRGRVLFIPMPGKRVLEWCSGLRPSKKEIPERRSGAFRHKNASVCVCVCLIRSNHYHGSPLTVLLSCNFIIRCCAITLKPLSIVSEGTMKNK